MSSLFLATSANTIARLHRESVLRGLAKDECVFLVVGRETYSAALDRGLNIARPDDFLEQTDIDLLAIDWLNAVSDDINGFARCWDWKEWKPWPYIPAVLYPDIRATIQAIEVLRKACLETGASELVLMDPKGGKFVGHYLDDRNRHYWGVLACLVATQLGIESKLLQPAMVPLFRSQFRLGLGWLKSQVFYSAIKPAKLFVRYAIGFYASLRRKPGLSAVCLYLSHARYWQTDPLSGDLWDEFYGQLLPEIRDKGLEPVGIDVDYSVWGGVRALTQRVVSRSSGWWEPFELSYGWGAIVARRAARRHYGQLLKQVGVGSFPWPNYEGIALDGVLRNKVTFIARHYLPDIAAIRSMAGRMLNRWEPKHVLITYETGPYGRAVIEMARLAGIPTLGLQHGVMHLRHPDYFVARGSFRAVDDDTRPDRFAVYGAEAARLLIEQGRYAPQRIAVTGMPGWDRLRNFSGNSDVIGLKSSLGIDTRRRTVLYASAGTPDSLDIFRTLCNILAESAENLFLAAKIHPAEERAGMRREFERVAASYSGEVIRIFRDSLSALITVCDVFVTGSSTTAIEAMIAGKPVVCGNFGSEPLTMAYVDSGAALGADSPAALGACVQAALSDEAVRIQVTRAQQVFLREQVELRKEGASKRVAALLGTKL